MNESIPSVTKPAPINVPNDGKRRSSKLGDPKAPTNVWINPASGCWEWQGRQYTNGYGRFGRRIAHRAYYEILVGPIPEGLTIDHLCRNKICVNPEHLECVTDRVNILRSDNPTALNGRKTKCSKGHELTEENTVVRLRNGHAWRECRECKNAWHELSIQRKKSRLSAT